MKKLKIRNLEIGSGIPKIISPVMERDKEAILAAAKEMKAHRVDAVEFRADAFEGFRSREALLEVLHGIRSAIGELPLLFTLRTKEEGGLARVTPEEYGDVVRTALAGGDIDLLDLEFRKRADDLRLLAQKSGVRVILSLHDFQGTPPQEEMTDILREMEQSGADIAKIAVTPVRDTDLLMLLNASFEAFSEIDIPLIAISMGEKGVISRVSGEVFGSAMTFASTGRTSAEGQLPADTLKEVLEGMHRERMESGHIFLIGFMGAGKTSVAKALSEKSGMPVVELDERIEQSAGMSIRELFAVRGEEAFRKAETEALKSLRSEKRSIVSCGGGIVMKSENIRIMKTLGITILLQVSPESAAERLKSETDQRPMLSGGDAEAKIRSLMKERGSAYEKAADLTVVTDRKSIDTICAEILLMVENGDEVL